MAAELEQIEIFIRARYPVIYVLSHEETRVIEKIKSIFNNDRRIFVWSFVKGFRLLENLDKPDISTQDPMAALRFISKSEEKALFVLCDFYHFLERNDPEIVRMLRELNMELKRTQKNIIIISPKLALPSDLDKEISVVEFPLPSKKEIEEVFNKLLIGIRNQPKLDLNITAEAKEQIVKALQGLTREEIENVLLKSLVETRTFSIPVIIKEKEQLIKKTGILEYFSPKVGMEHVGGLSNLKEWILKRRNAFKDKAREFGIPYPKGILLLGVQGCGKSLCCKVIGRLWNFPLLRLDMGAVFQGIVGSSENNMRRAIALAESISPCVLWVDEIEKGFSGIQSSNFSDAGTTARVFGTFLTWMQEKTAPVFIVATSNDISALPPELLRKGRFDEIFFVDLPDDIERREIFRIHLKMRNRNPENYNIDTLVKKSSAFSGAEIEESIISALYDAFDDSLKHVAKDLEQHHLEDNLAKTVPLAITMSEKINKMREWAATRARPASRKVSRTSSEDIQIELKE